MRVDFAAFSVVHPQRLDRADDGARIIADILWPDRREVGDVEDPHPALELLIERLAVGMARVAQRFDGLQPDRVRRHQPQHQRIILLHPGITGHADGVRGEDGLAAAGRQPQADIGRGGQPIERAIVGAVAAQPFGLLRLRRNGVIGVLRPRETRLFQKAA